MEEGLDHIDSSDTSGTFQIESRTARSEKLSGPWAPIGEAGNHCRMFVAGQIRFLDQSAVVQ